MCIPEADIFFQYLQVLYFQKLKHGELEGCQEPEPWLSAWTAKELSAMAETIQPEDCGEPGQNEDDGKEDAAIEETSDPSPEQVDVDHRKESSRLDGVREVSNDSDTHAVASDGDDDDDEPIAKRLRRRSVSRMTPQSSMRVEHAGMIDNTKEKGDHKRSTLKGGFRRASLRTTHQTGTSEDDDEDDQPIGIKIRIKTLPSGHLSAASYHLISTGSGVRNDLGKYRKRRLPIET
ncbi:hypothetical protein S245_021132, partial [Arachis hypogaea]